MPEHKPLYLYSLKEAAEWDEKDEWRESYLENCDCARAVSYTHLRAHETVY